jgi:stalled ribosome rescue protein Dom34
MAVPNHAIVWIDHHEARIFQFDRTEVEKLVIHPDHPTHQIHHKANSIGSGHAAEDQDFLHSVGAAIAGVDKVLIVGPANAKTELVKHLKSHDPHIAEHIAGVETVDHPSDKSLVAHARTYFKFDHQELPRES